MDVLLKRIIAALVFSCILSDAGAQNPGSSSGAPKLKRFCSRLESIFDRYYPRVGLAV